MTVEQLCVATKVSFDHHPTGLGVGSSRPSLSWQYRPVSRSSSFDESDDNPDNHQDHDDRDVPQPQTQSKSRSQGSRPSPTWQQRSYIVLRQRLVAGAGSRPQLGLTRDTELDSASVHSTAHVVASPDCILTPWPGPALVSRERTAVAIVGANTASAFRDPERRFSHEESLSAAAEGPLEWTTVEAGLLKASDWKARFITSTDPPPSANDIPHRPVIYQKTFTYNIINSTDATSSSSQQQYKSEYARLYISALGLYEAYINGVRVGDSHMAPGWTSYHHRVQYQTYDVTGLLRQSCGAENTLTVEVAEGWYAGRLLWVPGLRNLYGDKPGFIAQLEMHGRDTMQQVVSDESWGCRPSPRLSASIYDGEVYDACAAAPASQQSDLVVDRNVGGVHDWHRTRVLDFDFDKVQLVATDAPPVRITQFVKPINVFKSPSGKTLVDFGQNLVGRVQIRGIARQAGHTISIKHAEVLDHGELGTRPLRDAKATDQYIFSGSEDRRNFHHAPAFTFHGFRYAELEGWSLDDADNAPSADTLAALVVGSDMKRTGRFACSNELVNKLHENVTWSMRGNFLSIPTDCPQRDERLGWTGDIQAFAPTAVFLYASVGFLTNWLRDLSIDQAAPGRNGCVPVVIPDVLHGRSEQNDSPVAVWDDAAILVPWALYRWSGDVAMLRRQLGSMKAHLHSSIRRGPDGLWDDSLFQFGDWLDPNAPADQADLARTDGTLVADAYLVHVTDVMAKISVEIGNASDAQSYQAEFDTLKKRFADKYISKQGLVVSDSQTGLALAICFDLLASPAQLKAAGDRLERLVRQSRFKVATGFAGTPLVLHALTRVDKTEVAYEMLQCKDCPSWLYPVTMGATTIWERWDSMLPDGSLNPGAMTSFNHYALGSVADWLHSVVGGLQPAAPGWRRFLVRPRPGGGLKWCRVSFEGPYGTVRAGWHMGEGDKVLNLRLEVPPLCQALVVLPGQTEAEGRLVGAGICEVQCDLG
ncbi:bacterial alpha-L-rhamnosidase-domain-containing protein [Coniella lustricola]|uniref:alpha-L-rhamnosidase n=1 Tax=Coniella lustricola TaxID=2025994 RepID=A0A2T3AB10_9PEZI|nr:bacterial alpha-L-rhamnosidase-domain-containing protein [Coniella lustricola]